MIPYYRSFFSPPPGAAPWPGSSISLHKKSPNPLHLALQNICQPPMRDLTFVFIVSSFLLLTSSRCLLAAWQWGRVKQAGGLWPILRGGLRIDANIIATLAGIPLVLSPWLGSDHFAIETTEA